MLLQFSVENFMSIKEKVILSLYASADSDKPENVINIANERCLKTIGIYGPNASGKSNIFKAITAAIVMVRNSNNIQLGNKLSLINPFKFDNKYIEAPSKFEFILFVEGAKYIYGFSATSDVIIEEYLYKYLSAKKSMIFERRQGDHYKFTQAEQKDLQEIEKRNLPNKLFLSTATAWNYTKTAPVYRWFAERINTYNSYPELQPVAFEMFGQAKDDGLKNFTLNLLKEADININSYTLETEPINVEKYMQDPIFSALVKNLPNVKIGNQIKITTGHKIMDDGDKETNYILGLQEESLGTQNLFILSPILKKAFENGDTLCVDEINSSLHPLLVKYIIELFHNPDVNKNGAQLLFITHDVYLMSLELFRRDQIYFTEKDNRKGSTELFSLDEYSARKKENIRNSYLLGRFGSLPFVGTGENLWE